MQILLVDDDPALRETLRRMLTPDGYEVLTATEGHQAIAMAAECVPDAILLGRNLPDIDGLEVCRRLRRLKRRVPILMFGVGADIGDRVSGLEAGAVDVRLKPVGLLLL